VSGGAKFFPRDVGNRVAETTRPLMDEDDEDFHGFSNWRPAACAAKSLIIPARRALSREGDPQFPSAKANKVSSERS
jgi:hypothetical protein